LSAVAALVVAAVLVAVWALARPGSAGAGSGTSDGAGAGAAGGGVAGDPGSGDPGSGGGVVDRGADPGAEQPAVGRGPLLAKGAVRIDSYVVRGRLLLVNYTSGVPECYGEVVVGEVQQRSDAVAVTLRAVLPAAPAEQCIDLAVTGTLAVVLRAPLGERWVLDGGFEPEVSVRRVTRTHAPPDIELDPGPTAEG
jgi:hypothetical protein